jgi:hypothetical protein
MTAMSELRDAPTVGGHTFVIRIWSTDSSDALRGHIQHVRSRKRAYFATPQRLMTLIEDRLLGTERDRCQS